MFLPTPKAMRPVGVLFFKGPRPASRMAGVREGLEVVLRSVSATMRVSVTPETVNAAVQQAGYKADLH